MYNAVAAIAASGSLMRPVRRRDAARRAIARSNEIATKFSSRNDSASRRSSPDYSEKERISASTMEDRKSGTPACFQPDSAFTILESPVRYAMMIFASIVMNFWRATTPSGHSECVFQVSIYAQEAFRRPSSSL